MPSNETATSPLPTFLFFEQERNSVLCCQPFKFSSLLTYYKNAYLWSILNY